MTRFSRLVLGIVLCASGALSWGQGDENFAPGGPQQCLGCHDFGPDSPVHPVMAGSHGQAITHPTAEQHGCEDCHGPSADHANAPTQVSPAVSFGPRWSSTIAAQDKQCLACHEANVARHWQDALHMLNDLTCVTCHDIHQPQDKVLFADTQAEVCAICHKAQKKGIHGLTARNNPSCTDCHNPHEQASPVVSMLENRSEGCRHCHDLVAMQGDSSVSAKANSYHKVMAHSDRTCLDCHQGVAHAAADSVPPLLPAAATSRQVTLFYPGQASTNWLLHEHPGAQPLRQGRNCQQCHRGEEASMGVANAPTFSPASRDLRVSMKKLPDALQLTVSWQGPGTEKDLALMWGDGGNAQFERGGCFAACHSDLPGMSRDRGQGTSKYLSVSRAQMQRIGTPPLVKSPEQLAALLAEGDFVELWRVNLASGKVETSALLSAVDFSPSTDVTAQAAFSDGRWTVTIRRPLGALEGLKNFDPDGRYTFGIALHGADNPGGKHWVSLPLTLSFGGDDTDFSVR